MNATVTQLQPTPTCPMRWTDLTDEQILACDDAAKVARNRARARSATARDAEQAYWLAFADQLATYLPAGECERFSTGIQQTLAPVVPHGVRRGVPA